MEITCNNCGTNITDEAMGNSELHCSSCGQFVNGFGQCLNEDYNEDDWENDSFDRFGY